MSSVPNPNPGHAASSPSRANDSTRLGEPSPRSFYWWIDGVAGFLAFTGRLVTIGQTGAGQADVEVFADIAPVHLELRPGRSGVLFKAQAETRLNGEVKEAGVLHDGDEIALGSLRLQFKQPVPWSTTSLLTMTSSHRFDRSVDGILLLGESCVLGRRQPAHVRTPWDPPVVVHWTRNQYWVRTPGTMVVNGQSQSAAAPLPRDALVEGDWGSFRWEPRPART